MNSIYRTDDLSSRVLLVEDRSDKRVVSYLYKKSVGRARNFKIHRCGGWSGVKQEISQQIVAPNRAAVGIVVDANDDLDRRWTQVVHEIESVSSRIIGSTTEFGIPKNPVSIGTVVDSWPRVGIWIMPDNRSRGELEDFVATMIPSDDPVWPLSRSYINSIPAEHRKFREHKTQRAQVYAWTATLRSPGGLLAAATRNAGLDTNSDLAQLFLDWLRRLFG